MGLPPTGVSSPFLALTPGMLFRLEEHAAAAHKLDRVVQRQRLVPDLADLLQRVVVDHCH
jgi:hypothetical protein